MAVMQSSATRGAKMADVRVPRRLRAVSDGDQLSDLSAQLLRGGRGDRQAFAAVYDLSAGPVFGVARRVVRDPGMAEDVVQDVMVEVWRQAPRFDPARGSAMTWILTIAHRRAVDRVRSEQARTDRDQRVAADSSSGSSPPGLDGDPVARVVADESAAELTDGLAVLTDVQREAIVLAYYDGHTHTEVAEILGVPLGTAKTRIRDGLIKLRDVLP